MPRVDHVTKIKLNISVFDSDSIKRNWGPYDFIPIIFVCTSNCTISGTLLWNIRNRKLRALFRKTYYYLVSRSKSKCVYDLTHCLPCRCVLLFQWFKIYYSLSDYYTKKLSNRCFSFTFWVKNSWKHQCVLFTYCALSLW